MAYTDILYEKREGVAIVTMNRPQVGNAFRAQTADELIEAFHDAWADRDIGAVILTGSGERFFCTGGDQSIREEGGYQGKPSLSDVGIDIEDVHRLIRDIPKTVIAAVNGYAIGGGHVLHVVCDITIAAEHAIFGQVGPKVGSFDPGFGTAYLARVVGEKKAREIWLLCRRYSAAEAKEMGLVNKIVPKEQLMDEAMAWAKEAAAMSPTAVKFVKASFNMDTEHIRGIGNLGIRGLALYYGTEEAMEGRNAFMEKRNPDFRKFRK